MGEVLRPREGERPDRRRVPHPNHRRSPPSDNHWPRVCATRFGQALPRGRNPLSAIGATAADHPVGTQRTHLRRLVVGLTGIGPSVADRGAFAAVTQGGSLLASNDPITRTRQRGTDRPHRVAPGGRANGGIHVRNRTDPWRRFTASNSAYFYQVLVKRTGSLSFARENGRGAQRAPRPCCHIRTRRAPGRSGRR